MWTCRMCVDEDVFELRLLHDNNGLNSDMLRTEETVNWIRGDE